MSDLHQSVPPARAGAAVGSATIPRISRYGDRVTQSSLSTEAEEKLQEALSATGAPV